MEDNVTSDMEDNVTSEISNEKLSCDTFDFVISTVIIGILCLLGLTGNITSVVVLTKQKISETGTVLLLQVLSISDSVLLVTSLFVYCLGSVYQYTGGLKWLHDNYHVIQVFVWPIGLMAHTTTVYITVLVALNRYCVICRPMGLFQSYMHQATKVQVLIVVSFAILYNTPRFFEHQPLYWTSNSGTSKIQILTNGSNATSSQGPSHEYFTDEKNPTESPMNLGDSKIYQIVYSNVLYFPVMYIIPLLSLTYLNAKLIKALKIIRRKREALTGRCAKEDHITLIIVVIVCIFILCQTPALVNQIFWTIWGMDKRQCGMFHFYYTRFSDVLVVFNSSTNFAVYCLFGKGFRRIFIEVLCKNKYCKGPDLEHSFETVPMNDIQTEKNETEAGEVQSHT